MTVLPANFLTICNRKLMNYYENFEQVIFNRSSRRKRGMASNPLFIIPDFFCIFPINFAMATLGLKEMGKFLWEGREKDLPCWLSQFSISSLGKCKKKKSGIMKSGLDAMPLFLQDNLLNRKVINLGSDPFVNLIWQKVLQN